jgi:hypothetical protein
MLLFILSIPTCSTFLNPKFSHTLNLSLLLLSNSFPFKYAPGGSIQVRALFIRPVLPVILWRKDDKESKKTRAHQRITDLGFACCSLQREEKRKRRHGSRNPPLKGRRRKPNAGWTSPVLSYTVYTISTKAQHKKCLLSVLGGGGHDGAGSGGRGAGGSGGGMAVPPSEGQVLMGAECGGSGGGGPSFDLLLWANPQRRQRRQHQKQARERRHIRRGLLQTK